MSSVGAKEAESGGKGAPDSASISPRCTVSPHVTVELTARSLRRRDRVYGYPSRNKDMSMIPWGWAPYLLGSGTILLRGEVLSRSRHIRYSTMSRKLRFVLSFWGQ